MSYEILYGRQFIDVGNGTYIPLILSGSNNCTMFYGLREIRERHWWAIGTNELVGATQGELMQWITDKTAAQAPDSEWFMRGGKWLTNDKMVKWMNTGIRSAHTIEDIRNFLPTQSLRCAISVYDNTKKYGQTGYHTSECEQFIRTSDDLQKWIDVYKTRIAARKPNETICPNIEFSGIEPLKIGTKNTYDGAVICKIGNRYLYSYKNNESGSCSFTYGPDINQAITFANAADFYEKTKGINIGKCKLIKAEQPTKSYIIRLDDGAHKGACVERKTKTRLMLTRDTSVAKGFVSEAAAKKYIAEMLDGHFPACKSFIVEKIKETV